VKAAVLNTHVIRSKRGTTGAEGNMVEGSGRVCVFACARARARACVCVCVCV
jgi:hypothetical protein